DDSVGKAPLAPERDAKEWTNIVATDIQEAAGKETVDAIKAKGGKALFVRADVSQEKDCQRMVAEAVRAFGGVDVLYNNAGIFPQDDHSVIDTPAEVWDKVLAVNLQGVASACKYAIPEMIKRDKGSVINIASFVALLGCSVPQDAYTASKGAVIALTRSLAVQFGPKGIRTHPICPGPIDTPLLRDLLNDANK